MGWAREEVLGVGRKRRRGGFAEFHRLEACATARGRPGCRMIFALPPDCRFWYLPRAWWQISFAVSAREVAHELAGTQSAPSCFRVQKRRFGAVEASSFAEQTHRCVGDCAFDALRWRRLLRIPKNAARTCHCRRKSGRQSPRCRWRQVRPSHSHPRYPGEWARPTSTTSRRHAGLQRYSHWQPRRWHRRG